MTSSRSEQIRLIAARAVRHGWLSLDQAWDIALAFERSSHAAPMRGLFGMLSNEQLEFLQLVESVQTEVNLEPLSFEGGGATTIVYPQATSASPVCTEAGVNVILRSTESALPGGAGHSPRGPSLFDNDARYLEGPELGRGGSGRVVAATDTEIGRTVALKLLRNGALSTREETHAFLTEGRVTGQLEHPGIIPVYDMGALPDGQPYYSMPVIKHRTLHGIISKPPPREDWPLTRLCAILVQVCRAMAYAHARGVVHRDLKPANILLGDFGEVYIADWGIAKLDVDAEVINAQNDAGDTGLNEARTARLVGTPGYMPPEQIQGNWNDVTHVCDLFAIGAILFEVLTGKRAFRGASTSEILFACLEDEPPRPRDLVSNCPLVLEDLCLSLLSKDPKDRPQTAEAVAMEIEAFLEGDKEKKRRRDEAKKLAAQAKQVVQRYKQLGDDREIFEEEASVQLEAIAPWEPVERKQSAWDLVDKARRAETDQAKALVEAVELYTQAIGYDPLFADARQSLADLYWSCARRAEFERRESQRIYYEALVKDYDDGKYAALLAAGASLSMRTNPAGATVTAYRYEEAGRILRAGDGQRLGVTPLHACRIEPGNYLLIIELDGYRDVRYPILIQRSESRDVHINIYTDEEIGEGFVYIPGGTCVIGGDARAVDTLRRHVVIVEDFAIGRFPVTFSEYLSYVSDFEGDDPEHHQGIPVLPGPGGKWVPASDLIVKDAGKTYCSQEQAADLPVCLIDWFEALAYCEWLSTGNKQYRLPTDIEWEKAARGVDGREFPWGDHFDASFCKMRDSRPTLAQPEPIGAFAMDESPYGVRDLAGSIRTWVADVAGELSVGEARREHETSAGDRVTRGGAWALPEHSCRLAARNRIPATTRNLRVGLRVARTLTKGGD